MERSDIPEASGMSSSVPENEWHARSLRAWQFAILQFAVTKDSADRMAVMAIAGQIDALGSRHGNKTDFGFFRRTSTELCAAILQPNKPGANLLRQYLARIDDDRLKHVLAAAIKADQPTAPPASRSPKRNNGLWRGLSSRGSHAV